MESSELYHVKQQFILGAYKSLVETALPDPSASDYIAMTIYQARAHIAMGNAQAALALLPETENVAVKAASALAQYVAASSDAEKESALESLRDLSLEIEGDEVDGTEKDKAFVRVLAGTAFGIAGEVEEALEILGSDTEDLDAVSVIVHIYLSINRPDLAKKQFQRAQRWAGDDLLLQLIESNIGLVTGTDGYVNSHAFYTEQLGNPSISSPHILTGRGVTRLLQNEVESAKSDLEESLQQNSGDSDALAAYVVAAGYVLPKKGSQNNVDELWSKLRQEHPSHPLVADVAKKAAVYDEACAKFVVPDVAIAA